MTVAIGPANLIKAQILSNLQELVAAGVLSAVIEEDVNTDVLQLNFPGYPCAVLGISNLSADWEYQQANKRVYQYDILVVQLQDNLVGAASLEDVRDAIALQFDNNFTLAGTAPLGVSAVASPRIPVTQGGKTYVVFNVTIRATTLAGLTYSF